MKVAPEMLTAHVALQEVLARVETIIKQLPAQEGDAENVTLAKILREAAVEALQVGWHALDALEAFGIEGKAPSDMHEAFALLKSGPLSPAKAA